MGFKIIVTLLLHIPSLQRAGQLICCEVIFTFTIIINILSILIIIIMDDLSLFSSNEDMTRWEPSMGCALQLLPLQYIFSNSALRRGAFRDSQSHTHYPIHLKPGERNHHQLDRWSCQMGDCKMWRMYWWMDQRTDEADLRVGCGGGRVRGRAKMVINSSHQYEDWPFGIQSSWEPLQ